MHKARIVGILLIAMSLVLGACAPAPAPAEFEVVSLDIAPPEVTAGETVSITAEVENIGGSEGSYATVLTVDGVSIETKEVAIAPGESETITFSLVKDAAGTYEIGIGGLSSSLMVKPAPVYIEVELDVDSINPEGVKFVAPGSGSYEITIVGGATSHLPETDQNWAKYGGWRTVVILYINKPVEWGGPVLGDPQFGVEPINFDEVLGSKGYYPTIEEAEATGQGSSVTVPLDKDDYIIVLEHDHLDYYSDNSGTITIRITGYYQE